VKNFTILALIFTSQLSFAHNECNTDIAKNQQHELEISQLTKYQTQFNEFTPSTKITQIFNKLTASYISFNWKLYGYDSLYINAYAMQDGGVLISRGLELESDNIIAASLAHEISHIILGHSLKRACYAMNVSYSYDNVKQMMHSQEFEADKMALEILKNNGFPEQALYYVFNLISNKEDTFTHPSMKRRIENISNYD
jgi:Zn-dependent protease with chaperone function